MIDVFFCFLEIEKRHMQNDSKQFGCRLCTCRTSHFMSSDGDKQFDKKTICFLSEKYDGPIILYSPNFIMVKCFQKNCVVYSVECLNKMEGNTT